MQNTQPTPRWLRLSARDACLGDPLCELTTLPKMRPWVPVVIGVSVFGVTLTLLGLVVSELGRSTNRDMVDFWDLRQLGITLVGALIYCPLVWSWYTWQPRAVASVIRKLDDDGFLGGVRPDARKGWFARRMASLANSLGPSEWRRRILVGLVVLVLVAIGSWAYSMATAHPCLEDPYCFGKSASYITINELYFRWIWTPSLGIQIVMILAIGIRQVFVVAAFSDLFRTRNIKPKLFHTDGCCGMAFFGNFVLRSTWIPLSIGLWITFLTFYPWFVGFEPWFNGITVFYFVSYMFFPFLFLMPAWSLHKAMEVAKQEGLERLSTEVRTSVEVVLGRAQSPIGPVLEQMSIFQSLESAYQTIPFPRRRSIIFAVTYLIPAISILLQVTLG
jgi:hypothetical protein